MMIEEIGDGRMATDLIIDFNGYFMPNNEYKIKELSLFLPERDTVLAEANIMVTSKPPCLWEDLDHQSKSNYAEYFDQHGINWESGTRSLDSIYNNLSNCILESEYIYVRDSRQMKLLMNFLNEPEEEKEMYNIVCLEDLGYANSMKMSTYCHHHQQPRTKNCANDNLLDMTRWLKTSKLYKSSRRETMHIVVDFVGYDMPHGVFAIKEFSAIVMDHVGVTRKNYYQLVKPPCNWEELPLSYKLSYDYFHDRHGIPWARGQSKFSMKAFKGYFKNVTYVYVRNYAQKKLLMEFIGDHIEIISLHKFEFKQVPRMFTVCPNHKRGKYNCAADNSRDMTAWLEKSELYKPNVRKNYSNQWVIKWKKLD